MNSILQLSDKKKEELTQATIALAKVIEKWERINSERLKELKHQ